VKLATRCNISCRYCYWFRDGSVNDKPPVLTEAAEAALLLRLEEHIRKGRLHDFTILFHGGEPLLFGKARFVGLMDELERVAHATRCSISASITTNGILVDEEWARVFRYYGISVALSIDGPAPIHDANRIDAKGLGTHARVLRGLTHLRQRGLEPAVLAVCDPESDPEGVCEYFVENLGVRRLDIMIPDATHEDTPLPVAPYYRKLFDLWYERYAPQGISIRFVESVVKALLGFSSGIEAVGYGPIQLVTVLTDGALEPLDVLRIAGEGSTHTGYSVLTDDLESVSKSAVWREAYEASIELSDVCMACQYRVPCGGGYLPHRWSDANRFNNPSVYCNDLKQIFGHAWDRISGEIDVRVESTSLSLREAVQGLP